MNLKNWLYLFWTTLLIGAVAAMLSGFYLQWTDQQFAFLGVSQSGEALANIIPVIMIGLMFSIISQMGFFAYLTINYIALSTIRMRNLWNLVQIFLTVVVLFEASYLRYLGFPEAGKNLLSYSGISVFVLIVSLSVALLKVRLTNSSAFIPTLFFMSVVTIAEAFPSMQQNHYANIVFMMVPLLCCNAWQILRLHKLVGQSKKEPA